jgi:hypothetical protein
MCFNSGNTTFAIPIGQYLVSADSEGSASGAPTANKTQDVSQAYSSGNNGYYGVHIVTAVFDPSTLVRSIFILGDSIDFGYTGQTVGTAGAFGMIGFGLGNNTAWCVGARAGESLQNIGNRPEVQRRLQLIPKFTHVSFGWFINDRNNGRTLAQCKADLLDICDMMKLRGITGTMRTACPLTLSTNNWADTANQTEFGITVTGATNASPIVVAWSGAYTRKVNTGESVTITGVLGNTAANGTWTATYVDATHFSLQGSTGNGAYTSGGMTRCNTMADDLIAWNDWIKDTSASGLMAQSGGVITGWQDCGNAVMSADRSGKWAFDGTANKYTQDGIHPNNAGVALGQAVVDYTKYN